MFTLLNQAGEKVKLAGLTPEASVGAGLDEEATDVVGPRGAAVTAVIRG